MIPLSGIIVLYEIISSCAPEGKKMWQAWTGGGHNCHEGKKEGFPDLTISSMAG
jgi:hypothetical protein